jgi:hypothetical protein
MKAASPVQPLADTHSAVDISLSRLDVDIGSPASLTSGSQAPRGGYLLAADHAVHSNQDLDAVADGEDRLLRIVEMLDHRLDALVGADVFRAAPPAQ